MFTKIKRISLLALIVCAGLYSQVKVSGKAGVFGRVGLNLAPNISITSIAVGPTAQSQVMGSTVGYTATLTLSNGQTVNVTQYAIWSYTNPPVAHELSLTSTENAQCFSDGTTQVTAQYGAFSNSTSLTCTPGVPPAVTLTSVAVAPASPSVGVGTSVLYTATGTFSDGTSRDITSTVTWASSNTAKVKLGALTTTQDADCIATGTSSISATDPTTLLVGSQTQTCNAVLSSINVNPATGGILVGQTQTFAATCNFSDGSSSDCTLQAVWSSSATSIATIPANPLLSPNTATGISAGSSTITAAIGATSGTATLTVSNPAPPPPTLNSLTVTPANKTVNVGGVLGYQATCNYSDGSTQNCTAAATWTSSNSAVAQLQLPDAIVGSNYSQTLTGTGGTPYEWVTPAAQCSAGQIDLLDYEVLPLPNRNTQFLSGGTNPRYYAVGQGIFWHMKSAVGWPSDIQLFDSTTIYNWMTENNDAVEQTACQAAGYSKCFNDPKAYKRAATPRPALPRCWTPGTTITLMQPATLQSGNVNPQIRTTNCELDGEPLKYLNNVKFVTYGPQTVSWSPTQKIINDYYYSGDVNGVYQNLERRFLDYNGSPRRGWDGWELYSWNGLSYDLVDSSYETTLASGTVPAPGLGCTLPTLPFQVLPQGTNLFSAPSLNLSDSTGTISGTPLTAGSYPFTSQQLDNGGNYHFQNLQIDVDPVGSTPLRKVKCLTGGTANISAAVGAISGSTPITCQNPPPTLTGMTLNPTTASILVGATQAFVATGTFSDGTQKDVTTTATWASSSPAFATIAASPTSSPNLATGLSAGNTTISAVISGVSSTASLTVTNPGPPPPTLSSVTLSPKPCTQVSGGSCSYILTGNYSDGSTQNVTLSAAWTSGSPGNVQLTAGNPELGKCLVGGGATSVITGTFSGKSDNTTQTCNTSTPVLQTIAVTPANPSVAVGASIGFTATGTFSDGTTPNITLSSTWKSSAPLIAQVQSLASPQSVKCVSGGSATISATSGAVTGSTSITCIVPPPPTSGMDAYCSAGNIPSFGVSDHTALLPTGCYYTNPSARPTSGTVRAVTQATWVATWAATNCDDVVEPAPGSTITGAMTIPAKVCPPGHYRTLRVQNFNSSFPAYGSRATPCQWGVVSLPGYPSWPCASPANVGATIQTTSQSAALIIAGPTSGLQIEGIHILRNSSVFFSDVIVKSGTGFDHIILDRIWCSATVAGSTNRCFDSSTVSYDAAIDSFFSDFLCIAGGPGGLCSNDGQALSDGRNNTGVQDSVKKWVNNFAAASSETLFSGGGGGNIVPSDFEIRLNWLFKPMTWNPADPSYAFAAIGQPLVKNHLEFKNGNRILIEGNIMQNTWVGYDQNGSAVLMTPKNQSSPSLVGQCPLCAVTNVTGRYNYITTVNYPFQFAVVSSAAGFAAGSGHYSFHDWVADNLGYATCFRCGGNSGNALDGGYYTAPNAPAGIVQKHSYFAHNTIVRSPTNTNRAGLLGISGAKSGTGLQMDDYTWTNNFAPNQRGGSTGVANPLDQCAAGLNCNCGFSTPTASLNACFISYTFAGNCIVNDGGTVWPGSNVVSSTATETSELVNYNNGLMLPGGDFHLKAASVCHNQATDGLDPGADINTLLNRIQGVNAF